MTVAELYNVWNNIVADHYEIAMDVWRSIDEMPDTEEEYLTMIIELATKRIEG